ncbi:helix-turn-helix domain-containing protein [Algoriphagus sp. D3-2-R+10]|uniref:winged helix-turn-helix transcriptional regulator n=1 Tax=Algoriphagus aurantiacus TaxID=3103948 RepID=UPI002B3C33B4|nr:helix-turn-helix domain-containing protein [Algoriphagus sp. D3-2-R+10]MEB2775076.1 helix-turn-helix domain-containing protein [Algoriphagus sp. D3-2-R+10]
MKKILELYQTTFDCPVRTVLDRIGDKWSMLAILILGEQETMRFNELQKSMNDISQKMLTVTLRKLESDGLVSRTVYPEIPPRVEYNLTDRGNSLLPHIHSLSDWAKANIEGIKKSREASIK